ncbi:M48 family metalloprotease [Pyxidicoccus fallax]|uniref:M48 family metalloprotease n=2 Tax=Pyxidicoccus fallax TaxID=394095 RepID=A0A848LN57_9BACT|nr:M48 family metalloprotease [Pyxidicoccus fallax]NPC81708.1 M48 family metalloprotease [Pyxidicoccus fallax]
MLSQQPVFLALERALLEFLWQGAAVALVVAGLLALVPQRAARARYATACLGLLAMAVLPAVSFFSALAEASRFVFAEATPALPSASVTVDATVTVMTAPAPLGDSPWLEALRPWLLPAWCCGVLLLSARTLLAWMLTQRLARQRTVEPDAPWRDALQRALARMRMSGPVRLLASSSIDVPMVIGLWRPLILVPASAMTGLSAAQLEAILAHELAHIRRHDYLVNLLQSLVETLLFYHPAVWWLSHRIREEREHCADDLAVQCCGDAYLYARALAHIEQLRVAPSPQPALGAAGGSLLTRVRRLLVAPESSTPRRPWRLASGVGSAVVAVMLGTSQVPETARAEPPPAPMPETAKALPAQAPAPARAAPRLLVAPVSPAAPRNIPAPVRAARTAPRASAPKGERAPAPKARAPRSAPLLIPDTQSIARTELPRVPYSLDAEPSAPVEVEVAAPVMEDAAPVEAVAAASETPAESAQPAVLELGPGITPPRFLSGERFHYPDLAYGLRKALASFPKGSVVARCTITAQGNVTDCTSLQGLGGLEEAVIRTLSTWRYAPAMLNGKPVAVHYVFDIWFSNEPGGARPQPVGKQLASTEPPSLGNQLASADLSQYRSGAAAAHSCIVCTRFSTSGRVYFRSGNSFF